MILSQLGYYVLIFQTHTQLVSLMPFSLISEESPFLFKLGYFGFHNILYCKIPSKSKSTHNRNPPKAGDIKAQIKV